MDSEKPLTSDDLRVVVRPLPKIVFFYPTWLMSAACAIFSSAPWSGQVWMMVFFLNLLVIAFDFNEERSLILGLVLFVGILGSLYMNWLGPISAWAITLEPQMNHTFYMMTFIGFTVVYFFVWLKTRFDYWEFRPNEVVHRYGVFPKMKRYSTEDMRWDKSVPDLLERLLLGTGSIVLTTPHESHPVVLDHVMRIGSIDDRIANILGVKQVVERSTEDL
jgi:hypothetical protein